MLPPVTLSNLRRQILESFPLSFLKVNHVCSLFLHTQQYIIFKIKRYYPKFNICLDYLPLKYLKTSALFLRLDIVKVVQRNCYFPSCRIHGLPQSPAYFPSHAPQVLFARSKTWIKSPVLFILGLHRYHYYNFHACAKLTFKMLIIVWKKKQKRIKGFCSLKRKCIFQCHIAQTKLLSVYIAHFLESVPGLLCVWRVKDALVSATRATKVGMPCPSNTSDARAYLGLIKTTPIV